MCNWYQMTPITLNMLYNLYGWCYTFTKSIQKVEGRTSPNRAFYTNNRICSVFSFGINCRAMLLSLYFLFKFLEHSCTKFSTYFCPLKYFLWLYSLYVSSVLSGGSRYSNNRVYTGKQDVGSSKRTPFSQSAGI